MQHLLGMGGQGRLLGTAGGQQAVPGCRETTGGTPPSTHLRPPPAHR